MPTFKDVDVMAFTDGALDPRRAALLERTAEQDRELYQRICLFRDSRRVLGQAFAGVLREPVPARLVTAINRSRPRPTTLGPRFARVRQVAHYAMAACLVAGMSALIIHAPKDELPTAASLAALAVAAPDLATAASGEVRAIDGTSGRVELMVLASYRTVDGNYCRELEVSALGAAAYRYQGLACRSGEGDWELVQEVPQTAAEGTAQPYAAASGAPALPAGYQRLSPAEEARALQQGWKH